MKKVKNKIKKYFWILALLALIILGIFIRPQNLKKEYLFDGKWDMLITN